VSSYLECVFSVSEKPYLSFVFPFQTIAIVKDVCPIIQENLCSGYVGEVSVFRVYVAALL
jgi:hypothetical protein